MDFFSLCRKLQLGKNERNQVHKALLRAFPYGEHVELTYEELNDFIDEWITEQKYVEEYHLDIFHNSANY